MSGSRTNLRGVLAALIGYVFFVFVFVFVFVVVTSFLRGPLFFVLALLVPLEVIVVEDDPFVCNIVASKFLVIDLVFIVRLVEFLLIEVTCQSSGLCSLGVEVWGRGEEVTVLVYEETCTVVEVAQIDCALDPTRRLLSRL